jgi:hypothetical protein
MWNGNHFGHRFTTPSNVIELSGKDLRRHLKGVCHE